MKKDPKMDDSEFEPPLDEGIKQQVLILRSAGIETYASCEGGEGHTYPEPTIRFHGNAWEGFRAFAVAMVHGLNVSALRRMWSIEDGELVGPYWEMVFVDSADPLRRWPG